MHYYHGLAGGVPFWESEEVLNESLKSLKLIFELGGIHCRSTLKSLGIDMYNNKNNTWNGDDYISLCIENPDEEEFFGENIGLDSSFFRYVRYKVAIEFKPTIANNCVFKKEPYRRLPGERQVYKFIDISDINRILIGIEDELQDKAIYYISRLCEPYNIPVITFKNMEHSFKNESKSCK